MCVPQRWFLVPQHPHLMLACSAEPTMASRAARAGLSPMIGAHRLPLLAPFLPPPARQGQTHPRLAYSTATTMSMKMRRATS